MLGSLNTSGLDLSLFVGERGPQNSRSGLTHPLAVGTAPKNPEVDSIPHLGAMWN